MGVTFDVDSSLVKARTPKGLSLPEFLPGSNVMRTYKGGKLVKHTESKNTAAPTLGNGFVGACLQAYNEHLPLVLTPDDVWIAITTALSRYLEANNNAEKLRHIFVSHEGKKQLTVVGVGSLYTANYDQLISKFSDLIDQNTKDGIRDWVECNFSTTTAQSKIVSKVVLMGAMKSYFEYYCMLMCGLPKVTLEGTLDDWVAVRSRVDRLATWGDQTLADWSEVLGLVLDNFTGAFSGTVDKDFWNRIASITGGGSGPSYLQGWVVALIGFSSKGHYLVSDLQTIKKTRNYGLVETGTVPECAVEVPVTVDDNGTEYKTIFYAGALLSTYDKETDKVGVALDWALIDITNAATVKKQ